MTAPHSPFPIPQSPTTLRVALVHNWLTKRGGSEQVLFELYKLYPEAPIYTLVCDRKYFPELKDAVIHTSWLQHIPVLRYKHEFFPPIRYFIWRFTKLKGYNLVITSSSSENKAVRVDKPGLHIAYIHTPPHYYWRYFQDYLKNPGFGPLDPLARVGLKLLNPLLRRLDRKSAQNPDILVANSKFIQSQIKEYYGRNSEVIYPPVDIARFAAVGNRKWEIGNGVKNPKTQPNPHSPIPNPYFLTFGRQTVFKNTSLIIEAFNDLGLKLIVSGSGSENKKLKAMAGNNIEFIDSPSNAQLAKLVSEAKACIFANEEDFGITWVESMAAGTPVICLAAGGALETVKNGVSGLLFSDKTSKSLIEAVHKMDDIKWDRRQISDSIQQYSKAEFAKNITSLVNNLLAKK